MESTPEWSSLFLKSPNLKNKTLIFHKAWTSSQECGTHVSFCFVYTLLVWSLSLTQAAVLGRQSINTAEIIPQPWNSQQTSFSKWRIHPLFSCPLVCRIMLFFLKMCRHNWFLSWKSSWKPHLIWGQSARKMDMSQLPHPKHFASMACEQNASSSPDLQQKHNKTLQDSYTLELEAHQGQKLSFCVSLSVSPSPHPHPCCCLRYNEKALSHRMFCAQTARGAAKRQNWNK